MSKANNLTDFLTDVAGAIRSKKGYPSTQKIDPQDFETEIMDIGIEPNLQQKTVSPSTSIQLVTPDNGYDGLSKVTVGAISPTKAAETFTPKTYAQYIQSNRWLTGLQTIKGDSNLIASNIKKDVSIFGVTGTYEGSGGGDIPGAFRVADFPIGENLIIDAYGENDDLHITVNTGMAGFTSEDTVMIGGTEWDGHEVATIDTNIGVFCAFSFTISHEDFENSGGDAIIKFMTQAQYDSGGNEYVILLDLNNDWSQELYDFLYNDTIKQVLCIDGKIYLFDTDVPANQ